MSNASWPTKVRTYAVEGADSDLIKRYGSNVYKFKTNQAVKVAGLRSQMDILQSDHARALAKPLSKELAPMSLSGKLYIQKMSPEKFSKFTIESLRRSAWDGSEMGTSAEMYANLLKRHGYSAVNDLNLPGSAARVLLDKNVFDLIK